jgi:cell division protein FtsW (lipid II flippase)
LRAWFKNEERNFSRLRSSNEYGQSNAFATAFAFAAVLALATIVVAAALATALTLATILAFAVVLAGVSARRARAGGVRAVLCVGFYRDARHQSGDGCGNEEGSLCSAHNVFRFVFLAALEINCFCAVFGD